MKEQSPAWNWTPKEDAILRAMWRENATIPEISDEVGCSGHQVNRRRRNLQLPPRAIGWKPARNPQTTAKGYTPEAPKCPNADAEFARRMAGNKFDSLNIPSTGRARVWPHIGGVGSILVGGSSLELNA